MTTNSLQSEVKCTEDYNSLRSDLDIMSEWSHKWQLPVNVKKCKCMHFGTRNPKRWYTMANQMLEESSEERDLGVLHYIDESFKLHRHAAAAVIWKRTTVLGLIKSFITLDDTTYYSLIWANDYGTLFICEYGNILLGATLYGRTTYYWSNMCKSERQSYSHVYGRHITPYDHGIERHWCYHH